MLLLFSTDVSHCHLFRDVDHYSLISLDYLLSNQRRYPTTYLRECLSLSDWYSCGRGARAASGNDRPRTGDPRSCLAVHLGRTDFASGSTVHVHEFTCAFRHRRIRRSCRGIEGRARSNKRVAFSLLRRGEERSSHEVNEKSSGLQRLCGVRKISQETPFSPPIDS